MFDTRLTISKERWLADLYEANSAAVLRACWRILPNSEDAADACQEVFLRAANSLDPDMPRDQARAWLLTVARNYCLDQLRREKRFDAAMTRLRIEPKRQADPESSVLDRDTVAAIFKQLSDRERSVLWQAAVENRPLADIAARLHLNYMAAGQVVSRARRRASMLAAKVAAVFVVFRLITKRAGVLPAKLVAATAVPVIALTVQPSSSAPATSAPVPLHSSVSAKQAHIGQQASGSAKAASAQPTPASPRLPPVVSTPQVQVSTPTLPLPAGVSGATGSATGTLNSILHQLPTPAPVPTPSLPPPPQP